MKIYDSGLQKYNTSERKRWNIFPLVKSFDNNDDIFDRQKLPVRPDVCLLQRVQGQRLQSWRGGNTKGRISTEKQSI